MNLWISLFTCVSLAFVLAEGAPTSPRVLNYYKSEPALKVSFFSGLTCDICKDIFNLIRHWFEAGHSWDDIAKMSVDICELFKIEDHTVCNGIVWLFKDEVCAVFGDVALSPEEACNVVLGDSCSKGYDPWHQNWTIPIPGNKPPVHPIVPKPNSPVSRILHLTDIHYDPLYRPGLSNDCGEPLCCRIPNKEGSGSTAAGYWGDYECDIPYHTVLNLMENLQSRSSEYDWVYWTGDIPAHNVWNNSRDSVLDIIENITNLMVTHLPNKAVFPSFGNHEGVPVNSFPPPYITGDLSTAWLYNTTAEKWSVWLSRFPEWPTINATIRKGGYYVVKPRPGLRVISLQTNYCNRGSYWLLINSTDPAGQLQWLIEQLLDAEQNGDKVHIIGHIAPSLYSCLTAWAESYQKIVNRFESTIVGQFFGHTHQDSFYLYFDSQNTSRATNVAYISPSVTTYQHLNLGYRYFIVDGDHNESTSCVMDHVNYYVDLSKSSENVTLNWEFEYSAKEAYGLANLQPPAWADLVQRFQKNNTLFMEYFYHHGKMYALSKQPPETCDAACECDCLCEMLTSVDKQLEHCQDLKPVIGNTTVSCNLGLSEYFKRQRQSC